MDDPGNRPKTEGEELTHALTITHDQKPDTKFKAGISGNPSGRPKLDPAVKEMLQARTLDAVSTLVEIMTNPEAKNVDRIRAAEAFLDRAVGKAAQSVQLTGEDGGPVQLDMRAALIASLQKLEPAE